MNGANIDKIDVSAYKIPTASPESDGTLDWDSTTLVLVEVSAAEQTGIGYSYASGSTARFIQELFADILPGRNALDIPSAWEAMVHAVRNLGLPGVSSMAIAAVDNALWDLKGKLLGQPVVSLLGAARDGVEIYGSGGFTSYDDDALRKQLGGWVAQGMTKVKMKIGRGRELQRVKAAREAIGAETELYVDANGAYERKEALAFADAFADYGVTWFEEPVVSHDYVGLRLMRDRAPAGMAIAMGEYGYDLFDFRRLLEAQSVDVLQADCTRCAGISGWLKVAHLAEAFNMPFSSHCAPSMHLHPGCSTKATMHLEYFFDHYRIERMLFDGVAEPRDGKLYPDLSRPGLGLEFKCKDAKQFAL